jgi:hypothetical protein
VHNLFDPERPDSLDAIDLEWAAFDPDAYQLDGVKMNAQAALDALNVVFVEAMHNLDLDDLADFFEWLRPRLQMDAADATIGAFVARFGAKAA